VSAMRSSSHSCLESSPATNFDAWWTSDVIAILCVLVFDIGTEPDVVFAAEALTDELFMADGRWRVKGGGGWKGMCVCVCVCVCAVVFRGVE
jgi:hypothetical protein